MSKAHTTPRKQRKNGQLPLGHLELFNEDRSTPIQEIVLTARRASAVTDDGLIAVTIPGEKGIQLKTQKQLMAWCDTRLVAEKARREIRTLRGGRQTPAFAK